MRALVAMIATVCLLSNGCTWLMDRRTTASTVSDTTVALAALVTLPAVLCVSAPGIGRQGGECFGQVGAVVLLGLPLLLVGGIAGGFAASDERSRLPEADAGATDELERLQTDEVTLRMARQVRAAAARGQCVSVRVTMRSIEMRDARYHAALARSAYLEPCR